uniref:RIMS-binding protein 2 n=1 Tax=Scleropages formosus TaxID=113540 RepID=A0A8D0CIV0_SCLFO
MREAAERRQQLQLEHEQALAVLTAKQQEIDLLQKAQVEAKKEHEGAVLLLEAKVRELEEKCRTQSEQFNLLSKELEKFRLQAGKLDLITSGPLTARESPDSPNKSLSQLLNGLSAPIGKGNESPTHRAVISEFIRPLQVTGEKPELLSVKPTFLSRTRAGSPRPAVLPEMDSELSSTTRSKARYTGKVRLCIARYSYNPYDGPNENPEAELPLVAGKYLYVYGTMDEDGFYEGELLDGQRGLVPSNFVDFVQDEEVSSDSKLDGPGVGGGLVADLLGSCSNGTGTLDVSIDEIGEDIVPYPRKITLIKQLAKSVIVGWEPPLVPPGWGSIGGYNVLVDKEVRATVPFGGRTKSLIEKLNLATCTYRVSVQSVTERGPSDELRCTLLVGKDVVVAPYCVRVDNITQVSAELAWMPSNSNYSHTIFVNDAEYDAVKAANYKYQFFNLKPMTVYKVKVVAQPHQMPWQLPLEQREKREICVDFCTQPAGPPFPPQEVQVHCGQSPGVLQVRWKPPLMTPNGTSNGAKVIGYAVCTKGQKIAEVMFPTADYVMVELNRIQGLEAREVIVRTLSAQGESQDSPVATIPPNLLPQPQPHPQPQPKPLASARESETKEQESSGPHHGTRLGPPWELARSPSPLPSAHPHTLEPPHVQGRRSPSPQRILPQPQGGPISNTAAKAIVREAAQRVAENNRVEKKNIFSERSGAVHPLNSDEEEDGYESPHARRRGASVDDFLRGSELGRQPPYSHSEEYQTESSRGSDLSDILEEDEEELYSEMQLEEGQRRGITSHSTLKPDCWDLQREVVRRRSLRSKRLHSIPEVAEEELDGVEALGPGQRLRFDDPRPGTPRARHRACLQEPRVHRRLSPGKGGRRLPRQRSSPRFPESRQTTKSPDSGLDCGSEEEGSLGRRRRLEGPAAGGRKRTLTRQCSVEEDFADVPFAATKTVHVADLRSRELRCRPGGWKSGSDPFGSALPPSPPGHAPGRILGTPPSVGGPPDRLDHSGRRPAHGGAPPQRRPMTVPSIDGYGGRDRHSPEYYDESEPEDLPRIFVALFDYDPLSMSPNPDGAEEELPFKEGQIIKVYGDKDTDGFYRGEVNGRTGLIPCNMVSEIQTEDEEMMEQLIKQGFLPLNTPVEKIERNRRSGRQQPVSTRRMVALYDYDPRESSPNVDVEAELTFCAGDIITVFGEIDEDGFYYGELNGHKGLVPSNFLEEVPDDVEVYLTDSPSCFAQDAPARTKTKRKKSVHFTP